MCAYAYVLLLSSNKIIKCPAVLYTITIYDSQVSSAVEFNARPSSVQGTRDEYANEMSSEAC